MQPVIGPPFHTIVYSPSSGIGGPWPPCSPPPLATPLPTTDLSRMMVRGNHRLLPFCPNLTVYNIAGCSFAFTTAVVVISVAESTTKAALPSSLLLSFTSLFVNNIKYGIPGNTALLHPVVRRTLSLSVAVTVRQTLASDTRHPTCAYTRAYGNRFTKIKSIKDIFVYPSLNLVSFFLHQLLYYREDYCHDTPVTTSRWQVEVLTVSRYSILLLRINIDYNEQHRA